MRRSQLLIAPLIALTLLPAVVRSTSSPSSTSPTVITTVSVEPRAPTGAIGWPIAVNVPFAPGIVQADQPLALRDGGIVLPTQLRPLLKWPDGSLRWARLDGLLSRRARGKLELAVIAAVAPAPPSTLRIEETPSGIAVDTGAVAFEVPRDHFAIAENLRLGRGMAPALGVVTVNMIADGQVHSAAPPRSLRVTSKGLVHGELELTGVMAPDFEYLIRIAVDAGSPFVRVLNTYTKATGRADSIVERMSVDIPFAKPAEGVYEAGVERGKPLRGEIDDDTLQSLAQPDNLGFTVGDERRDGQLSGWFELATKSGAVGLASRWFWQEYPKAVSLGPRGITFDLWSPKGGTATIGIGSAKTHELVLWLAPRGAVGKARAPAVATPLRGFAAPAYTAKSGALRGTIDPNDTTFDEALAKAAQRYAKRNARDTWHDCGQVRCAGGEGTVERTGAFGMLNWGDWNFPGLRDTVKGTDAWGNLEYDTTQVLALTHAATADAEVFDAMAAAARHFMDVDTIHALPGRSDWVGMNHPKNPRHFSFQLGGVDLGHTWTEGLLSYYQLTGDERALSTARGIADYLVRRLSDFMRGNPRQWGWPQIALVSVYDVTGEQRYLEAARGYARAAIVAHPAAGKIGWKLGILADGLAYTHAHGGGAEIESWLRHYAELVAKTKPSDARFYPAVAYMGRVAGKPEWLALARQRAERLDLGNWGKPFTIQGRLGLRIESLAQTRRKPLTSSRPR